MVNQNHQSPELQSQPSFSVFTQTKQYCNIIDDQVCFYRQWLIPTLAHSVGTVYGVGYIHLKLSEWLAAKKGSDSKATVKLALYIYSYHHHSMYLLTYVAFMKYIHTAYS